MDGYVTIGTKMDLAGLEEGLRTAGDLLVAKVGKMEDTIKKSLKTIKKVVLAYGLFSLFKNMFDMGDAISRVDTLNNYARVMGNLGISSDKAQKSIDVLSDKLTGLPTTLDDAAQAVQRFTSANGNIEASTEMFLALNNAILAGGASTQIQKSALEQLSQAYTKGKPDMMEWRTAMMAMPAQLKQVAMAMGYVNSAQLGEALRTGKVSMNEFMATITKLNKEGIGGFQSFEEQAKNSTGGIRTALTNLKTTITRAMADILNAVGQTNISDFFNSIGRAIQKVVPYIAGFAKALLIVFGITGKTKKSTSKASVSMDNLGSSSAGTSKKLTGASKSAKNLNKELKKLASFDEMNILDKLEKSSGGGGTGGVTDMDMGMFDTSAIDNYTSSISDVATKTQEIAEKIAGFIRPLVENWEMLVGVIYGAKAAVALFINGVNPLLSLGIGLMIAGIIELIISVIEFIKDPSWENFMDILGGLATAVMGVAVAMIAFNATNPVGWITLATAAIVKIIDVIGNHTKKLSDEELAQKRVKDATKEAKKALEELQNATNNYVNAVDRAESAEKKLADAEKKHKISGQELFDMVARGELDYKDMNAAQREVYKAYLENKDAQENLKKSTKDLKQANEDEASAAIKKQIAIADQKKSYEGLSEAIVKAYDEGRISAEEASNLVALAMRNMSDDTRKTFLQEIPQSILSALDTNIYAKAFNGLWTWWDKNLKKLNGKITVKADVTTSGSFSGKGFAKGGLVYFSSKGLPKLASGGIINQPGRGVPIASAIGGERRAEGVIPLTDSQQMALLGEAIGKYITINANIVNEMNGRVISRELKQIENESNFAFNN